MFNFTNIRPRRRDTILRRMMTPSCSKHKAQRSFPNENVSSRLLVNHLVCGVPLLCHPTVINLRNRFDINKVK